MNFNKLTNLTKELTEKLNVIDFVFNNYFPQYTEHVINTEIVNNIVINDSTLIELELLSIRNNINTLYNKIEEIILDEEEQIQQCINTIAKKNTEQYEKQSKLINTVAFDNALFMMLYTLELKNPNSFFNQQSDIGFNEINAEIEKYANDLCQLNNISNNNS